MFLAGNEDPVVVCAEDLAEGVDVAEQRPGRLHVLDQAPQLREGVLHRRRRQQQHGRRAQEAPDAVCHQGVFGRFVVDAVTVVALVECGEDLVGLVYHDQVEGWTGAELLRSALAAGELAPDEIDTGRGEIRLVLLRLNPEQVRELVLPLPDQRLGHDQQDALGTLRPALRDHQAGFDRLAQADLVGEDAASLFQSPEREDHGVDLVGVRIDAGLPLRRGIALAIVRAADADEVLCEHAEVERVESHSICRLPRGRSSSPAKRFAPSGRGVALLS